VILLVWVAIKVVILFDWAGIRRVIKEAVKKPSMSRESGVSLLLYNIMKGGSSRLHSKADRVLQLLTSEAIFHIGDGADQGKLVPKIIYLLYDTNYVSNRLVSYHYSMYYSRLLML
jgi:hypothetical protein